MWNGFGFYDKAVGKDCLYQNYKLGLFLFTVKATGFESNISNEVEKVAWSYQKENCGIASLSYINGVVYGTANVETTSILLLSYNDELINKFQTIAHTTNVTTSEITSTTTPTSTTSYTSTSTPVTTTTQPKPNSLIDIVAPLLPYMIISVLLVIIIIIFVVRKNKKWIGLLAKR